MTDTIENEELKDCNTIEEVENYRVRKIKELTQARNNRNTTKQAKLLIQKKIIILQGEKKDLEISEDKANHIISTINADMELAKIKFWRIKN